MKVLILGRGVIGSQYGWALEQAGHRVDFFIRKSSKHTYADYIVLHTYDGRSKKLVDTKWNINLKRNISTEDKYDLIIISVNPEQVKNAVETVAAFAGDSTIMLMGNFGGNPVDEISVLPKEQFVVGFPSAGGGITNNELHGIMYGSIQIGLASNVASHREEMVKELFASADFKVSLHKDINSWLWNHYVANAAMEAEVLKRGSFEAVVSSNDGLKNMMLNIKEMVPYLKAKGITPDISVKALTLLPASLMAAIMTRTLYKPGSPAYNAIAYNKYTVGYSVAQILEDAQKLNVSLPRLKAAHLLVNNNDKSKVRL
ncbi:MAG: ketopantoate reductase family protein [Pseudobutyrivibrio sp.]|nr:ketopantoate reductase family protein [Pseudobutyrivibrio sp.]